MAGSHRARGSVLRPTEGRARTRPLLAEEQQFTRKGGAPCDRQEQGHSGQGPHRGPCLHLKPVTSTPGLHSASRTKSDWTPGLADGASQSLGDRWGPRTLRRRPGVLGVSARLVASGVLGVSARLAASGVLGASARLAKRQEWPGGQRWAGLTPACTSVPLLPTRHPRASGAWQVRPTS